jgi:hypothetical protein
MIAPLPNCLSIAASAVSIARVRSGSCARGDSVERVPPDPVAAIEVGVGLVSFPVVAAMCFDLPLVGSMSTRPAVIRFDGHGVLVSHHI